MSERTRAALGTRWIAAVGVPGILLFAGCGTDAGTQVTAGPPAVGQEAPGDTPADGVQDSGSHEPLSGAVAAESSAPSELSPTTSEPREEVKIDLDNLDFATLDPNMAVTPDMFETEADMIEFMNRAGAYLDDNTSTDDPRLAEMFELVSSHLPGNWTLESGSVTDVGPVLVSARLVSAEGEVVDASRNIGGVEAPSRPVTDTLATAIAEVGPGDVVRLSAGLPDLDESLPERRTVTSEALSSAADLLAKDLAKRE